MFNGHLIAGSLIFALLLGCNRPRAGHQMEREARQAVEDETEIQTEAELVVHDSDRIIHATPHECFAAMCESSAAQDVKTLLSCWDKMDQDRLVGWLAFELDQQIFYESEHADAARLIFQAHDIKPGIISTHMGSHVGHSIQRLEQAAAMVGRSIKDRNGFAENATALVGLDKVMENNQYQSATLSDIQIQGNSAEATVTLIATGETKTLQFKKQAGSWLMIASPILIRH